MEPGVARARLDFDATERFVPLRRRLGVTAFGLNQMVLEPGQRGRIHRHAHQEEVYLVLEGTLSLLVEGEEQTLEHGELVRVAPTVRRQLVNRGPGRVVLLASGAMSHKFWPLKALRDHEPSDPVHIRTDAHRAADLERLDWMQQGRHDVIIDTMDDFLRFTPEGRFGHYLQMVAAIGGRECRARGELFSDYESAVGTGQAHVWFERPPGGWTAPAHVA